MYTHLLVMNSTPFFRAFGPLLFGKPPVGSHHAALAEFSEYTSLSQLRKVFGSFIPQSLLSPRSFGPNSRKRVFTLETVFWSFLDQVQTPHASCREAVRKIMALLRRKFPSDKGAVPSPDTSAYCQARAKLPLDVLEKINEHLIERLQKHIPTAELWHGRHVKVVDGTGLSMPDTPANQSRWPQSKSQKPGCGFPSMTLVGVFCLLSGALIRAATGDRHCHETGLFRSLWEALNPGDLLLADRGFCSFSALVGLHSRKVDSVMRLPERKIRKAIGSHLPKAPNFDVIVSWKRPARPPKGMSAADFESLPQSVRVRVIRYTLARYGFRTQSATLVTTLLDDQIDACDFAELYFRRWNAELFFREIKIWLNMDVLRCLSPHMIEREVRMHFIAYNLVRSVMQKASLIHDVDLARVSFKGALDTLRQFANACSGFEAKPRTISALIDEMLRAIARDPVPSRPARTEPRVKKRRPKNYRLLTMPRKDMTPLPHRKCGRETTPKSPLS
jgi:hypothetical protein